MRYRIVLKEEASKQLDKLDKVISKRILSYLDNISINPEAYGKCLKHDFKGIRRYRVGKYRVLASLEKNELKILVLKVGHRFRVYS